MGPQILFWLLFWIHCCGSVGSSIFASLTPSCFLPTIILFDFVWWLAFTWLQRVSKKAVSCLQQTLQTYLQAHFQKASVSDLRKQMHVGDPVGSCCSGRWFADWQGSQEAIRGSVLGRNPMKAPIETGKH